MTTCIYSSDHENDQLYGNRLTIGLVSLPTMPQNVIDPSVLSRLDSEYVAFHNAHLLDYVPTEHLPWDPKIREQPAVPGASHPQEVGLIRDFTLSKTNVRAFTPKGDRPSDGWPVFIWLHGGSLANKSRYLAN